ncbi:chitin deacetylase [Lunasporangiospora selenospora]|uniref:Chitin deacetylase n=1 Tax=Lunasporangiospora selenospora TaxID=979761 RepID=A0A9P6KCF0_9FUNG|nr:chitin deacetylase [Lunasporangiospora selenospora]
MKFATSTFTVLALTLAVVKAQVQIKIDATKYPALQGTPDVKHPQVQAWLKEIDLTGAPTFALRKGAPPECPAKPDPAECIWTCDGCAQEDITACGAANTWGVTFDDGPSIYTPPLLDFLKQNKVPATFFLIGGNVIQNPDIVKRELDEGHHLASHTWSHSALTTLTNEQIVAEMKWTEKAVQEATGVRLKYMRPPYGDINNRVRFVLKKLGYKVVDWTGDEFDTKDWQIGASVTAVDASGKSSSHVYTETEALNHFKTSLDQYAASAKTKGFYCLEHDIKEVEVNFAKKLIPMGQQHQSDAQPYQEGGVMPPSGNKGNNTNAGNGNGNGTNNGNTTNPTIVHNKNGTDTKSAGIKSAGGLSVVIAAAAVAAGAILA